MARLHAFKPEGPFGIKTASTDDRIENIIQGKYISYANDDGDYPDVTCIKKKGAMPKPKPTVASELLYRTKTEPKVEKPRFIMNRFKKVQPTMHMHLTKVERDIHHAKSKIDSSADAAQSSEKPEV